MIKLINRMTGTEMWVADERLEEYLAKGHTLASSPVVEEKPKPAPKKPARKTAKKTR